MFVMEFINLNKPLEAGKEAQVKRKRKVIIVNEIKNFFEFRAFT